MSYSVVRLVPYNPHGRKDRMDDRKGLDTCKFILDKMDFNEYWRAMNPLPKWDNRKMAARDAWDDHPEKHQAIMAWLKEHGDYPERNPYFFILDFTPPRPKEKQSGPTNYRGREIPHGIIVHSAKYNDSWGMYTWEDIEKYHLLTL